EQLQQKLEAVLNIDEAIVSVEKKIKEQAQQLDTIANELSGKRNQIKSSSEASVNALLSQVGMPNGRIKVSISDTALNQHGKNAIEFLFDANRAGKSNPMEPLRKIASGGELSRLMLCI